MTWFIEIAKGRGEKAHIDIKGDVVVNEGWRDEVRSLYEMLMTIGEQDERSKRQ